MQAETDYLVIGAGASGLAFADSLIAEDADAELTLVERRPGPGKHTDQRAGRCHRPHIGHTECNACLSRIGV